MITCQAHGAAEFANLLVTKENGVIVLNPHVANCCVLQFGGRSRGRTCDRSLVSRRGAVCPGVSWGVDLRGIG